MSGRGVASSGRIVAAERREQAWELKKRGFSYRQIAERLDSSKSTVERDVKRVLDELNARTLETAAEARALDLARLDELLVAWFETAMRTRERAFRQAVDSAASGSAAGDVDDGAEAAVGGEEPLGLLDELDAALKEAAVSKQAADIVFKVLEQRAKLLGLYRQEVALVTPAPLQVAADLSGLDEESLDAIIRNLSAASGAGAD